MRCSSNIKYEATHSLILRDHGYVASGYDLVIANSQVRLPSFNMARHQIANRYDTYTHNKSYSVQSYIKTDRLCTTKVHKSQLKSSVKILHNYLLFSSLLGKKTRIDIRSMKSKFYRAFNGLFHNAAKLKDELTTMHLVLSLYGRKAVFNATQRRSLSHM